MIKCGPQMVRAGVNGLMINNFKSSGLKVSYWGRKDQGKILILTIKKTHKNITKQTLHLTETNTALEDNGT